MSNDYVVVTVSPEHLREHYKVKFCGDCRLWMTQQCPRESDAKGNKPPLHLLPFSNSHICDKFVDKSLPYEQV